MGTVDEVTARARRAALAAGRRTRPSVMSAAATAIEIKTPEQIRLMRRAGLVVGETLELLRERAAPA